MIPSGIILDETTRKLQVKLDAAGTIPVTVNYYDIPQGTKTDFSLYRGAVQFTTTAGVTDTDICPAPSQGKIRVINYISVYNSDGGSENVSIMIDDNGTNRIQVVVTLATTESLVWTPESGWKIVT